MAIDTLREVRQIDGFNVAHGVGFAENREFIIVNDQCLSFLLQKGPIKEVGINGCQVDTVIETAKVMLEGLNRRFPCDQNEMAIDHLGLALGYLADRKKDRSARGVEGLEKK